MANASLPYMYIAYIVLGVTSCSANATLIWIILRNKNFLTVSNVIIVSLATSDFMLGIVVSPMEMTHHVLPDFQIVGNGCLAHQVLMIFVPLVSIVHLLLIAFERFVKIVYPLHYHGIATRSRTAALILFAWIFPFSLCMIPFLGVNKNMELTNETDTGCSTLDLLPCHYLHFILGLIGMICIVMAVFYSKIVKVAFRHAKQIRRMTVQNLNYGKIWRSSELRALSVLLMTVLYFVLSWAPFCVAVVDECISGISPDYYTTAVFVAYFNSTVKPLIYGIGNRELRNSFLEICCRRKTNKVIPAMTGITTITVAESKMVETEL